MPISKSVPGPVSSIHAVGQTVARHPIITVIPPLSRYFGHCSFPPKVHLQPLVAIVPARAPGTGLTFTGNFVKAGKMRDVIGVC